MLAGGSSLRDHRQADGSLGYFQHNFRVYNRVGRGLSRRRHAEGSFSGGRKTAVRPFIARNARNERRERAFGEKRRTGLKAMASRSSRKTYRRRNHCRHRYHPSRTRASRVALKRNGAARRFTLRVRGATSDIVLTMPRAPASIRRGISRRPMPEWLASRLARLPQRALVSSRRDNSPCAASSTCCATARARARGAGPVWVEEVDGVLSICAVGRACPFRAPNRRFPSREEARRDLERAVRRYAAKIGRAPISLTLAGHVKPVGILFGQGRAEFFLAADSRRRPSCSIISPPTKQPICAITTIRIYSGR